MEMQMEEARAYVFQALRDGGWNQFSQLLSCVGLTKARLQKIDVNQARLGYEGGKYILSDPENTLILEVVWGLIVQGILIPGSSSGGQGWPFLRLTQYGESCVKEDRILPHDPDGFLKEFRREVLNADPTVVEYLTESLQCYIHGLQRSAAVMLGGASEQAVLLMIETYSNSMADPTAKQKFVSAIQKTQSIFRKYELFERQFIQLKNRLPKELTDNVDSELRGVFDLIRSSRNDAGHPAMGTNVSRDTVYSHLRLFPRYCRRIHELIGWFAVNHT